MSGTLTIVGLGPGAADLITPAVSNAVDNATDLVGYDTYIDRVPNVRADQTRHASDNGFEVERAKQALDMAVHDDRNVVVVSSGDPGVFAMAAAVFEAIEQGPDHWRTIDVRVEPGITAMLAAAAHLGAPLGGDFCTISLSDNLKSWDTIETRLEAAARADFAIALYNPASKARPLGLKRAFDILSRHKPADTVVAMVRAAGTSTPSAQIATLATIDLDIADMRTLVLIGANATRVIERPNATPWVYTLRSERGST